MLESVLIANRGEIACRIIRTCRRLGVRTVAVCSDADRNALHVRMADEAVRIGPPPARESYLSIPALLEAARRTGAAAVHPGYGFLSERAAFARAVGEAGLVWIGPPPDAIEAMGGKDRAKRLMRDAGVPVVPGYDADDQAEAVLAAAARDIGIPVLLKAAAGGGGKGMRVVDDATALPDALAAARREAAAAFGDDRMIVEKYLRRPRHVEVQVFGDRHGNAVHLFERDCSLQRRHQKIVEEAPAPGLPEATRAAMGAAGVAAARAVGYVGAGTVEFLLDADGAFYFIEMNTRLQVEHPVTEMITGLDLVEWQLRVAAGEPLPLRQDQIVRAGHSVEARLYAEDPARGYLPSAGRLDILRFPPPAADLRVETGVEQGDEVTPYYDPMIAKLVVHGPDRPAALRRLGEALAACVVVGPATNLAFLQRVVGAPPFADAPVDTGWLDREGAAALPAATAGDEDFVLAALAAATAAPPKAVPVAGTDWVSPWNRTDGWRMNRPSHRHIRLASEGRSELVTLAGAGDSIVVTVAGRALALRHGSGADGPWCEVDGHRRPYRAHRHGDRLTLVQRGRRLEFTLPDAAHAGEEGGADDSALAAPMPGRVIRLFVAVGDTVAKGQPIAVLEAMKMEQRFEAPRAGRIAAVHVAEGEQVAEGTRLVDLEADGEP
ncbi:MAG: biotin carboxylase N-terminal domain-containing protein [Geminicoccaceae bacterium]